MADVTTTGYMILGLLSTRDWSAYDIASQSGKGMTELWPRADRQLYNAPRRLVDHGLAHFMHALTLARFFKPSS